MTRVSDYALKTFRAYQSDSVKQVFPEKIIKAEKFIESAHTPKYIGLKDTDIPPQIIKKIEDKGYLVHTIDKRSHGGRAIDYNLRNPITGRYMTGSSSGTAINVFLEVNDIGIGTDGGGSVLSPASALNLYGFISPNLGSEYYKSKTKESTDGIVFYPSLGFISKELENIVEIYNTLVEDKEEKKLKIIVSKSKDEYYCDYYEKLRKIADYSIELSYNNISRREMISELKDIDFENNMLITYEGPTDLFAYGDSIIGHYSSYTRNYQSESKKNYSRVINMAGLAAIVIPTSDLSLSILIITKDEPGHINRAFKLAKKISSKRSKLENSFFSIGME